ETMPAASVFEIVIADFQRDVYGAYTCVKRLIPERVPTHSLGFMGTIDGKGEFRPRLSSCVQPGMDLDARNQAEAIVLRLISSNSCCVMEPVSSSSFAFPIWDAGEPLAPTDL